jgi:aminoglycoside 3-N-acetyltransferase
MTEEEAIKNTKKPHTVKTIVEDLKLLGIKKGDILLVHSSLSKIGWIAGGPIAVIQALMQVLTEEGTLIMPTHSGDYSDPKNWSSPPVPEFWKDIIRNEMPAFDSKITPTRGMGKIAETFRNFPGVLRSYHPHSSFAAWGKTAEVVTKDHVLENSLGEDSPLDKLYGLKTKIMLLGVSHPNNTSLHFAEYKANYPNKKIEQQGGPIMDKGVRKWVSWEDINLYADDFKEIGKDFEADRSYYLNFNIGKIGNAETRLLDQKILIDYAIEWMEKHRK